MAVNFEDTVFGFDLNYLHQTTDYTLLQNRIEKQRMAILKAKKKTICTDTLIRKYHEKQQLLEEMERDFLASNEECKQIRIEYQNSLEKCSKLEMETKNLHTINQDLENKLRIAENHQEGSQAHNIQLQMLIKDYETRIEALKIEKQLEKSNARENEKKISDLTKDNFVLMKNINVILDVALKNNNISSKEKNLLCKYIKLYKSEELSKEVDYSGDETDTIETYECSVNTKFSLDASAHTQIGKPIDYIDRDSNGSNNEIASIDTGRGSSLAFSDSDKCFQSPEYFSDNSPLHVEVLKNKVHKTCENKATSPIYNQTNNAALSPIQELQVLNTSQKQTSVIKQSEIGTSPIKFAGKDILYKNNPESEGLALSGDENSNDCEIESILSSMRFNQNLITPIPCTPSRSHARILSTSEHSEHTCLEAAKVREENKTLQTSVSNLAKEVMSIKSMLRLHLMTGDSDSSQPKITDSDVCIQKNDENKRGSLLITNKESVVDLHSDNESQCSIASLDTLVNECPEDDSFLNQSTGNNENYNKNSNLVAVKDTAPINASQNLLFEEDPEKDEDIEISNYGYLNTSIQNTFNTLPIVEKKNMSKLTRLQRLRVKMLPKGKIPIEKTLPQRRFRMKPKQIKIRKKKPSKTDSSATLNNKEVYEKAVKVMAELKSKNMQNRNQTDIKQANIYNPCDVDVNSNNNYSSKLNAKILEKDSIKEYHNVEFGDKNTDTLDERQPEAKASKIKTGNRRKNVDIEILVLNMPEDDANKANSNEICKITRNLNVAPNDIATQATQEIQKKKKCLRSSFSEQVNYVTQEIFENRKSLKRPSCDEPEIENKRVLRSSSAHIAKSCHLHGINNGTNQWDNNECKEQQSKSHKLEARTTTANYSDLDMFTDEPAVLISDKTFDIRETQNIKAVTPQESILCAMLEKYGVVTVRNCSKKNPETVTNSTCKKIQDGIAKIIELPQNETRAAMNSLVESLRKCHLNHLLMGLMQYLKDPARKAELFSKVYTASAPPMTKSEQVLLYILSNLQGTWPGVDFIGCVLDNMEYTLFKLNRTPDFEIIESMSHFYAVLCRYMKNKSRLRLFVLDAMYCIQYKAVPLIKQCMEVWMHILPLAHLGIAKSPLVMCVVYLLHFFKCEDRFNRVMEIRNILSQKYFFKLSDWNETKILEMFRSSIKEIKDDSVEKKMLRLALIVLAKRQGPQWCQNNIIKNLLQPMIEDGNSPERVRVFCLSMLGPLIKPYPVDMKVHCEVVMNQLSDLMNGNSSPREKEAIVTSLIYMSKHNHNRVVRVLLSYVPTQVSPELETILKGYVREKPLKIWKQQLSRLH